MGTPSPDLQFLLNLLVLMPFLIGLRWIVRAQVRLLMTLTGANEFVHSPRFCCSTDVLGCHLQLS